MTKDMRRKEPNPEHTVIFRGLMTAIDEIAKVCPKANDVDLVAILGRVAGYRIAMFHRGAQDLMREALIANIDASIEEAMTNAPVVVDLAEMGSKGKRS